MNLPPFTLERWFARYEFEVDINLCASCAPATSTDDILSLAGEQAREDYLHLGLDYIPNPGTGELRRQVAGLYHDLDEEYIQVTTGASEAIFLLMNCLFSNGDNIIVQQPAYQSLYAVAGAAGVQIKAWPLQGEEKLYMDPDALKGLIDSRTRAVVVNNPHNPTGYIMSRQEMDRLVEVVEHCGLWLISDEVYRGIIYNPPDELPAAIDLTPRAICTGDMTKPYGLGGLRTGWLAVRDKQLLSACGAMRDYTTMCNAAPAEFLAVLALQHRRELLEKKLAVAKENLARLADFMNERPGLLSYIPPRGGFTVFPRYHQPVDSTTFCRGLVERKSVLLLPGAVFSRENHFRLGLGVEPAVFRRGLELFGDYLAESDYS
ncbi:aminotransferase class I/II-fold pyridoxal phosphate-dependent enzyme [Desulfotomaculum copahuensis]|uniref:Aminotransferase class I/classII large domain-containing protein n=1 Tax=Desulfotomaculum copahuensis TaxID=1838280 RepID=A0A1B7LGP0_9FIRM|nr:aminotransferase class I/II-fold pyridoxal phosphate-dependent enzyme [Desulfotomaculum copahuensis]OAT85218.1 hypothetical protein A6M21_06640 [Desulfotomaculum copahuensis]